MMIDSPEQIQQRAAVNCRRKPHERRKGMPTANALREAWGKTSVWRFKGFDSQYEFMGCPHYDPDSRKHVKDSYCMACGWHSESIARCHIVPLLQGGSNEWWNLHLLCDVCHSDSELLGDTEHDVYQERYWSWFFERTMIDALFSAGIRLGVSPSKFFGKEGEGR